MPSRNDGVGGAAYVGKPRPVFIVQVDQVDATDSVTVALRTRDPTDVPLFRVAIEPGAANGLVERTRIMADKVSTMPRTKLGRCIGTLGVAKRAHVDQTLRVCLGLAG